MRHSQSRFVLLILAAMTVFTVFSQQGWGRGEWESSGAPTPPYIPQKLPIYTCEVKASLSKESNVTANFVYEIKPDSYVNGQAFIQMRAKDAAKVVERNYGTRETRSIAAPAWLDQQNFSIRFSLDHQTGVEQVHLSARATLDYQTQTLSSHDSTTVAINAPVVQADANISHRTKAGSDYNSLSVEVKCQKK